MPKTIDQLDQTTVIEPAEPTVDLGQLAAEINVEHEAGQEATRGLQGNAWHTVLGIPYALGIRRLPVVIRTRGKDDASGVRHAIYCDMDPAGNVIVDHRTRATECHPGTTTVTLALPARACDKTPFLRWGTGFALFNPHLRVKILKSDSGAVSGNRRGKKWDFCPTAPFPPEGKGWRKFLPGDKPSAWWFDDKALAKLVFAWIGLEDPRSPGRSLFDFVRGFRGLTDKSRAKTVCEQFPLVVKLGDFRGREAEVSRLLLAMRNAAEAPAPTVLGFVGEDHLRNVIDRRFGVSRFWYKKDQGYAGDIPFTIEAAIATTKRGGQIFHGINFSPTFDDPLSGARLILDKKLGGEWCWSLTDFLKNLCALPRKGANIAVAFHLACPALEFTEKGKTRLKVPYEIATAAASLLCKVGKHLWREGERRKKDAAAQERADQRIAAPQGQRKPKQSLVEMFFKVMREAYDHETDFERIRTTPRFLFYSASDLVQTHFGVEIDRKQYNTFSQKALPLYRRQIEPLPKVYYEPRGTLYEPHTGRSFALGDEFVEGYEFPLHLYDKILFVEKEGSVWAIIEDAGLAEKYDMLVITGKGYATEACRKLLAKADASRNYQIFVAHDADPWGYNIARTLQEETERMPGHHVEIIDLGLKIDDAFALGMKPETFTRKKGLPRKLIPLLTDRERRMFEGRLVAPKTWVGQRFELNLFGAAGLANWLDKGLADNGATGKVIPPPPVLAEAYAKALKEELHRDVEREYRREIEAEASKRFKALSQEVLKQQESLGRDVSEKLVEDPSKRWLNVIIEAAGRLAAVAPKSGKRRKR